MASYFKIGADGSIKAELKEMKGVDADLLRVDDKSTQALKDRLKGQQAAAFRREHELAEARLNPQKYIYARLDARQLAVKANIKAVDEFVDNALKAGRPLDEVEAMAHRMTAALSATADAAAELSAPSGLAGVAWGAQMGAHGAPPSMSKARKPRKAASKRKAKK
jgi:hypothetical protein